MSWGISDKATDKEKIFAEFNDCINGLNCVGEIDYGAYSQIYDFGRTLADREYEQGKADERRKFVDWLDNGPYLLTKVEDVWGGNFFGVREVEVDFYEVLAEYEKEQK